MSDELHRREMAAWEDEPMSDEVRVVHEWAVHRSSGPTKYWLEMDEDGRVKMYSDYNEKVNAGYRRDIYGCCSMPPHMMREFARLAEENAQLKASLTGQTGLVFEPIRFTVGEDGHRVIHEAKLLAISIDKTEQQGQ